MANHVIHDITDVHWSSKVSETNHISHVSFNFLDHCQTCKIQFSWPCLIANEKKSTFLTTTTHESHANFDFLDHAKPICTFLSTIYVSHVKFDFLGHASCQPCQFRLSWPRLISAPFHHSHTVYCFLYFSLSHLANELFYSCSICIQVWLTPQFHVIWGQIDKNPYIIGFIRGSSKKSWLCYLQLFSAIHRVLVHEATLNSASQLVDVV